MATRLDLALQRYPDHAIGIHMLAARDPSGKLKYLDWGAKILASDQALAQEVADVTDLFHRFNGQRVPATDDPTKRIATDIHTYRPQDLANLRDTLLKIKRAQDHKRKKRERLYRIDGDVDTDVVFDGPDLIVRHVKNKQASVHYGHQTKWCIAMLREGFFEDYEANNATFFFFERKAPVGDEFDKVAVMMSRGRDGSAEGFTSVDRRVDMMVLAKVYGSSVFDIFRQIYECSERYPGSATSCVYQGNATREQIEAVFAGIGQSRNPYDVESVLEAICCNDAAPLDVLVEISHRASALSKAAWNHYAKNNQRLRRRGYRRSQHSTKELDRVISAALVVHPSVPDWVRQKLVKNLRKQHVKIDKIRRVDEGGRIGILYRDPRRVFRRHRHLRRKFTLTQLRRRLVRDENQVARTKKAIKKMVTANKKKKVK